MTPRLVFDRLWPLIALLALIVLCSLLALVNNVLEREVTLAMVYLVLVASLYMFTGLSGVASFGHIAFMAIGAYTTGLLTIDPLMKLAVMNQLPDFIENAHWATVPAVLMGGVVAAVFAALVSLPLMRLSGLAASLATFAVLNIVFIVCDNWTQVTNGSAGIADIPTATTAFSATVWALLAVAAAFAFQVTRLGLRLRSSREDDIAAQALGVTIVRERRLAFILSAFIGGVAGGMFAGFIGSFNAQSFYLSLTFLTFVMLVVGGTRSLAGAVIGSLFISLVSALLVRLEAGVSLGLVDIPARPGLREIVLALIMLGTLILRPTGITGGREIPPLRSAPKDARRRAVRVRRKFGSSAQEADEPSS
jgi:branched-chain amino acid transport system permease protein